MGKFSSEKSENEVETSSSPEELAEKSVESSERALTEMKQQTKTILEDSEEVAKSEAENCKKQSNDSQDGSLTKSTTVTVGAELESKEETEDSLKENHRNSDLLPVTELSKLSTSELEN